MVSATEIDKKELKGRMLYGPEYQHGGYYYAFTDVMSRNEMLNFREVFANIVLPTQFRWSGNGEQRNAYIAFGLFDHNAQASHSCDIGICSEGGGTWHLCYGGTVNPAVTHWRSLSAPAGTTNAIMVARNDTTKDTATQSCMYLYVKFMRGSSKLEEYHKEFFVPRHNWNKYYRFMSFLSEGQNLFTDETFMKDAKFTNLGIYDTSKAKYLPWGINPGYSGQGHEAIHDAWIYGYPKAQITQQDTQSETFTSDNWAG